MLGCRKVKCVEDAEEYLTSDDAYRPEEAGTLDKKVRDLCTSYDELIKLAQMRSETLQGKMMVHELQQDLKEMDHWIHTKLELLDRLDKLLVIQY